MGNPPLATSTSNDTQPDALAEHFTRLIAPFLAGFSLPTIAQLVTGTSPPQPWRDIVVALFVAAAGLLLAGFQMSIGSLYSSTSEFRPLLSFAGLGLITLALATLVLSAKDIAEWNLLVFAVVVLGLGVFVPMGVRIRLHYAAPRNDRPPLDLRGNP